MESFQQKIEKLKGKAKAGEEEVKRVKELESKQKEDITIFTELLSKAVTAETQRITTKMQDWNEIQIKRPLQQSLVLQ